MRIDEQTYQRMPEELRMLFLKEPNPQRDEVVGLFPDTKSGSPRTGVRGGHKFGGEKGQNDTLEGYWPGGSGSAARFFYCAKASKKDRNEGLEDLPRHARPTLGSGIGGQPDQQKPNNRNIHPTVKPTDLMRYLCRLITQPGGVVLDPFMGSGSTGKAAVLEGFIFVGIDIDRKYVRIAKQRIKHAKEKLLKEEPITL